VSVCAQKISGFGMLNNGKVKNKLDVPNKNADLLKKIRLMGTRVQNCR